MAAEAPKAPPVAVRVIRPFKTEDEFVRAEFETITRTGVVLVGTGSRPQGLVLRFELALESGTVLLRGEGRVVGFKPRAIDDLPGLTLRFTRLDTRSKALVDKIAAIREERARQALQASMGDSSAPGERTSVPPPPEYHAPAAPRAPAVSFVPARPMVSEPPVVVDTLTSLPPSPEIHPPAPPTDPSPTSEIAIAPLSEPFVAPPPSSSSSLETAARSKSTTGPVPPARGEIVAPPPPPSSSVDIDSKDLIEAPDSSEIVSPVQPATAAATAQRTPAPPVGTSESAARAAPPRTKGPAKTVESVPNRNDVLARLRERSRQLSNEQVSRIEEQGHRLRQG